ncbi:MAG: hypothetical protein ACP5UC_00700 [Candidatus Micrarchaeia archaeon]
MSARRVAWLFVSFAMLAVMFAQLSFPSYVKVIEPYGAVVHQGGSVYLGNIGPGQSFYIVISPNTTSSSGKMVELGWNKLVVTGLSGWVVENSSLYSSAPSVEITPPSYTPFGVYGFNVTAINIGNYSGLGNLTFKAYINVTSKVFSFNASPAIANAGIGVPAYISIRINNTGVSDNPFVISASGLPGFNESDIVIAQHSTARSFLFPIYEDTPGTWHAMLKISSLTSPSIYETKNITLIVKPSMENELLALGKGTIIYPVLYAPAYAIQYFIGLLFKGK